MCQFRKKVGWKKKTLDKIPWKQERFPTAIPTRGAKQPCGHGMRELEVQISLFLRWTQISYFTGHPETKKLIFLQGSPSWTCSSLGFNSPKRSYTSTRAIWAPSSSSWGTALPREARQPGYWSQVDCLSAKKLKSKASSALIAILFWIFSYLLSWLLISEPNHSYSHVKSLLILSLFTFPFPGCCKELQKNTMITRAKYWVTYAICWDSASWINLN